MIFSTFTAAWIILLTSLGFSIWEILDPNSRVIKYNSMFRLLAALVVEIVILIWAAQAVALSLWIVLAVLVILFLVAMVAAVARGDA